MTPLTKVRTLGLALLLLSGTACSRPGVNAGVQGGRAWIIFSVMLLAMLVVLWVIIGRED